MPQNATIARPYARAVFADAVASGQLAAWGAVLHGLALIAQDAQIKPLLHNPTVPEHRVVELLHEVIQAAVPEAVKTLNDKVRSLLEVVCSDRRVAVLPAMDALYKQYVARSERTVNFEVVSAYALPEARRRDIEKALEQRFDSRVAVEYKEDEKLIGGAVIRTGNWVMDDTIKNRLVRLRAALAS